MKIIFSLFLVLWIITTIGLLYLVIKNIKDKQKDEQYIETLKSIVKIEVHKLHAKNSTKFIFTDSRQIESYKKFLIDKSLYNVICQTNIAYEGEKPDIDTIEYFIIAYVQENINIKVDTNPNQPTKVMRPDELVVQSVDIGESIMGIYN